MGLPKLKKCCFCLPIETGCVIVVLISLALCISAIAICSWKLPEHRHQQNEDNIVLLSMTMFTTLSALSNLMTLVGIALRRSSYVQLAILSNVVFILCILLVTVVSCLFSPTLKPYLETPGHIALAVLIVVASAVYSFYYLAIVNSMYSKMKMTYGDSAIPV